MNKVILIGRINRGHLPIGGETAKNQALVAELGKYCHVTALDFYRNKQRPWVYVQAAWALLSQPSACVILSTSAGNIYPLLKAFQLFGIRRNVIHWIVGGEFDRLVMDGRFDVDVLNVASHHLAQSHQMVERLTSCGVKNVSYIVNFRNIDYTPVPPNERQDRKTRFVFMSRIMREKGVADILTAVASLNVQSLQDRFTVDFYGRKDETYQTEFEQAVAALPNVAYRGMLDLRRAEGYATLASYDAMLFPTYHPSEGIAGAIIDAYMAGIPVVATDWGHNTEIVEDGVSGLIVPTHNVDVLAQTMSDIIEGRTDLSHLSAGARNKAQEHRAENVITKSLLKELDIL